MRNSMALMVVAMLLPLWLPATARATDNHAGYYYPNPVTSETYVSALNIMTGMNKRSRVGFLIGLNKQQLDRAYPPPYHIFAKGFHA